MFLFHRCEMGMYILGMYSWMYCDGEHPLGGLVHVVIGLLMH